MTVLPCAAARETLTFRGGVRPLVRLGLRLLPHGSVPCDCPQKVLLGHTLTSSLRRASSLHAVRAPLPARTPCLQFALRLWSHRASCNAQRRALTRTRVGPNGLSVVATARCKRPPFGGWMRRPQTTRRHTTLAPPVKAELGQHAHVSDVRSYGPRGRPSPSAKPRTYAGPACRHDHIFTLSSHAW